MKAAEKLSRYVEALRMWIKHGRSYAKPLPEQFGLKTAPEKFAAETMRKQVENEK
jgi:hypothetical protein